MIDEWCLNSTESTVSGVIDSTESSLSGVIDTAEWVNLRVSTNEHVHVYYHNHIDDDDVQSIQSSR